MSLGGCNIKELIFSVLCLISTRVLAVTYINHFNTQLAGEIGLIALGLGKEINRYSIGGMYGVVPAEVSGGPVIETVVLRQTYEFYHWKKLNFHLGLNLFHVLGVKYQTQNFGNTPDNYYPNASIRGLLNLGISANLDRVEKRLFYFETGLNDIAIVDFINNYKVLRADEEFSLALGIKQRF